jgi:4-amino-4-deoxy-L-arabinose transferase-like glycosyltransferase
MRRWDTETNLVWCLAGCVSVVAFLFYLRRGEVLLYGDAVAHINIARRVFDSRTPGLLQLGTVWLPLPHVLMIPFLLSDWAWRTGVGGSIPPMIAYVFGAVGIFRLVRGALGFPSRPDIAARIAAWGAVLIYVANPNLIYLATTAMTEPLYLALFIWTVAYFTEFVQAASGAQENMRVSSWWLKCGLCLAAACLTRYDGWFLAGVMCAATLVVFQANRRGRKLSPDFRKLVLLAAAAPVFWLAYNAILYRNPLEFANGPYSAPAIERKTGAGAVPHPGTGNLAVAASYFVKSAELNLAAGGWQKLWVALLLAGTLLSCVLGHRLWPLLLLWVPLPFYMLSVAYGGVPMFVPAWWPFSRYNLRYGLELLPAFAVFVALSAYFLARLLRDGKAKVAVVAGLAVFVGGSYASIWRDPVCFREAWINSRTRIALEGKVAAYLKGLPPDCGLLMYLGDHVGALQQDGIPLRRLIGENNHRTWKRPSDPEGLWERALANPGRYVDFVIAFEGDPVFSGVQRQDLLPVAVIQVPGQAQATIYRTHPVTR